MAQSIRQIYEAYSPQVASYERLALFVRGKVSDLARQEGMRPIIEARAKDVRSLIRKCLMYEGTVDETPDRAGVKVVVRYASEVCAVNALITGGAFEAGEPDHKSTRYKPNEFGYLGTHHQVKLLPGDGPEDLQGLECEIIVHTGAETLWDSVTHELMYKPFQELPVTSQRSLHRLSVLVELFDKEVAAVRSEYLTATGYREKQMLDILEKYFYRLDHRDYRPEMSIRILEALAPEVGEERLKRFDDEIGEFVEANKLALETAYSHYQDVEDYRGVFLHQPESLLIFAMFAWNQKDAVKRAWLTLYPRDYLEELGGVWSITIPR